MWRLEAWPAPSRVWVWASPVLALALTTLLGMLLFAVLGKDLARGLQVFFLEPVRSVYALGELGLKAAPLLLMALGLALAFRSNVWNIGAEGQFVMGAVFAGGVALAADASAGGLMSLRRLRACIWAKALMGSGWITPSEPPTTAMSQRPNRIWSSPSEMASFDEAQALTGA